MRYFSVILTALIVVVAATLAGCEERGDEGEKVKNVFVAERALKYGPDAGEIATNSTATKVLKTMDGGSTKGAEEKAERKNYLEGFEKIEALEPPNPKLPVPKVIVNDLGFEKPPVPGQIIDAFSGIENRLNYVVTEDAIYVMGRGGKVKRRIKNKGYTTFFRSWSGVVFSMDGHWFWRTYVLKESVPDGEKDPEYYADTDVYDDKGKLWWTVHGAVDAISPDGKKATIVWPELMGMDYVEKGWEKAKPIRGDFGDAAMMGSCVFNDGLVVLASRPVPAYILVMNRDLDVLKTRKMAGSCRLHACLPELDRVIFDCAEIRHERATLYTIDSKGREISRTWFPFRGNRFAAIDLKKKRVLIGVSTGEALYLNPLDGDVLNRTKRLDGFPESIPMDQFKGNKKDFWNYGVHFAERESRKFLIYRAVLVDGAIVLMRKPIRGDASQLKKRIIDVVDFSGKTLFSEQFEVGDTKIRPGLKLPVIWKAGGISKVQIGNKVKAIETMREVAR